MNKTLCITATMALAFSGAAFAKGNHSHSRSSAGASTSQQFSATDCDQLSVQSARASCMKWIDAHPGSDHQMNVGGTSDTATGAISGGSNANRTHHKRSRHRMTDAELNAAAGMSGAQDMSGMRSSSGMGDGAAR